MTSDKKAPDLAVSGSEQSRTRDTKACRPTDTLDYRSGHRPEPALGQAEKAELVRKAAIRMSDRVGLHDQDLAAILGVTDSRLSGMRDGQVAPELDSAVFDNALLLIRALDGAWSLFADDNSVNGYLYCPHRRFDQAPIEFMRRPGGLAEMVRYMESQTH